MWSNCHSELAETNSKCLLPTPGWRAPPILVIYQVERRRRDQIIEKMREKETQEKELSFMECVCSIIVETEAAFKAAVNGRNEVVNVEMGISQTAVSKGTRK